MRFWATVAAFVFLLTAGTPGFAAPPGGSNPDFLIHTWLNGDGIPENSALAVAQTPDGYLWVGTSGGLLRFDGIEFSHAGQTTNLHLLSEIVQYLHTDRSGRLWVSTLAGMAVLEHGAWHKIEGPNVLVRSVAEDSQGRIWAGGPQGTLHSIRNYKLQEEPAPPGLTPSGVFCIADAKDGTVWLANRGFVGRLTSHGWQRFDLESPIRLSLVATAARTGGVWTYAPGELKHYHADGKVETFAAPVIEQGRDFTEDHLGNLWVASVGRGLARFTPGSTNVTTVTATNGLVHNTTWCIVEDHEGNMWAGSSSGGLSRLRTRQFINISTEDGLPDQIVRTVAEDSSGRIIVGTHGGGTARIKDGKVVQLHPTDKERFGIYAWTVLGDKAGRTWTGTYTQGLLVEENGVEREFPLPLPLGRTLYSLFEDSKGRILAGTVSGLAIIENNEARPWTTDGQVAGVSVRSIAEDTNSGAIWIGTYNDGVFRLDGEKVTHFGRNEGLPNIRISSLMIDGDGCVWVGVFEKGLVCIRDGHLTPLGPEQGFPADTAGSILEDGLGWFWIGSNRGILRCSSKEMHAVVRKTATQAAFNIFDTDDGLGSADCSEGFQPAAMRDHEGNLWFATLDGVVRVNPRTIQVNTVPPPVVIERVSFIGGSGTNQTIFDPGTNAIILPPGSSELQFVCAALTYSSPEKAHFAYRLEGAGDKWVDMGDRRTLFLHELPPRAYSLTVKAANNDEVWNSAGATLNFKIEPFLWQTMTFRFLVLAAVAGIGGVTAWRLTHNRLKLRIAALEQQRALEKERARLASVMESTSDLVAFADNEGTVLHINPAGRNLLGLPAHGGTTGMKLADLHPRAEAQRISREGIPTARQRGTWESETILLHHDGREIPVSQVIMAHKDPAGRDNFLSTIARDITERRQAEQEGARLRSQLLQAQKMESVGRLAGGIAHDFNNMLQVILGNCAMAIEQAPPGSLLHSELLGIQKSANRSAALTRQLLTFARKQNVTPGVLDLNEIVGGMLQMLQRLIGENIQLVWRPGPDLWPVKIDPAQIDQVLANLAINARDAIRDQGKLSIETSNAHLDKSSADISADFVPGEYVLLSVSDTGSGMTKEVLEHLFEPFFTTKDIGRGTGLGLAMVFGIVKQNKGLIQVASAPDQGATFKLYFPRTESEAKKEKVDAPVPGPPRGSETILLVEDEPQILELGGTFLQRCGYNPLLAATPAAALTLAAQQKKGAIHLLVTDVMMPGMNGRELKEKIEALHPGVKTLMMSSYAVETIAHQSGADSKTQFLPKPFTFEGLAQKIRDVLDSTKA